MFIHGTSVILLRCGMTTALLNSPMVFHVMQVNLTDQWEQKGFWKPDMYHNSPILKGKPAPFVNEVVAKGSFLWKVSTSDSVTEKPNDIYCKKKDPTYLCWLCSTRSIEEAVLLQEEGLTNEVRHHLLLLHKQAYDKKGIAESLHVYITRVRLTKCEVGILSIKMSQHLKIRPPLLWGAAYAHHPWAYFWEITVYVY